MENCKWYEESFAVDIVTGKKFSIGAYCLNHNFKLNCQCLGDTSRCDLFPEIRNQCVGYYNRDGGWCLKIPKPKKCSCEGDKSKCEHYTPKKETLNTIEMVAASKKNGLTYKYLSFKYNPEKGFCSDEKDFAEVNYLKLVNDIFNAKSWEVVSDNEMTVEEAEKKFGIKIIKEKN